MNAITKEQAEAMDDMANFGQRVSEDDLNRRISENQACANGCRGDCAQGRKPCVIAKSRAWCEVMDVVSEESPIRRQPRPRLGGLSRFERRLLQRTPTYTWAGITLFAVFAALARGCWA